MLSPNAQKLIDQYFNLPFLGIDNLRCPYFNNARPNQRGQLRVLVGKGQPSEIVEEAKIISIQYHKEIFDVNGNCLTCQQDKNKAITKFLVDNNLGVDCSAFVTHILNEHFKEKKEINLLQHLKISQPKKFLRYLITKLRPVENINVKTYTNNANTKSITPINKIKTADLITMLETGPRHKRDHILLVTNVKDDKIDYVHARAWSSEGKYGHGVTKGVIKITNPHKTLLDQEWEELGRSSNNNETYLEAKNAKKLETRRIIF